MEPKIEYSNGYRILVDSGDTSRRSSEVKTYKLPPEEIEALLKKPAINQKKETCYAIDGEKVKEIRKDEKVMKKNKVLDVKTTDILDICKEHGTGKAAAGVIAEKFNLQIKQAENLIIHRHIREQLKKDSQPSVENSLEQKAIEQKINEIISKPIDEVNCPEHYTFGNVETIDYIKAKFTPEMFEGLCVGAAIQYLSRYKHKGGIEDLKKAQWYLDKIITVKETA